MLITSQLAQAELRGVVAHALKAQFAAQLFKVKVVAVGQRLGHVHAEAGELHHGVARDQPLRQRGQGHGQLDGGAGLGAGRKRQLLVDHGQNAAIRWVDDHGRAVHVAERVDRGLTHHRIFAGRDVTLADASVEDRADRDVLVITMMADKNRAAEMSS